jgi:hypothetical protein
MDENDDTLLFVRKTSRPLLLTSTVLLQSSSTCHFWDWRSRRPGLIPPQVCIRLSIYEYHTLGSSAQILKWRRPSTYIFFLWFFSKYNNSIDLISHLTSHWHPQVKLIGSRRRAGVVSHGHHLVWTQELLWSRLPSSQKEWYQWIIIPSIEAKHFLASQTKAQGKQTHAVATVATQFTLVSKFKHRHLPSDYSSWTWSRRPLSTLSAT